MTSTWIPQGNINRGRPRNTWGKEIWQYVNRQGRKQRINPRTETTGEPVACAPKAVMPWYIRHSAIALYPHILSACPALGCSVSRTLLGWLTYSGPSKVERIVRYSSNLKLEQEIRRNPVRNSNKKFESRPKQTQPQEQKTKNDVVGSLVTLVSIS